jgi:hypothetical protein
MPARRARVAVSVLLIGTVIGCRTTEGQAVGGFNGSYRCFTTSMMQVGAAPNARDRNEREKRGMHELERGERAVPIAPQQQIMIMPAFFGNVVMDGRGGYRLTGSGHTGGYAVNRATSAVTFTGDLKIMELRRIEGRDAFFLVYQDMAFECGNQSGASATSGNAGATASVGAAAATPAAARIGQSSDFTGRFSGSYTCGDRAAPIRLDLQATPAGQVTGVVEFGGGDSGRPHGSFAVRGAWSGDEISLGPDRWIVQPAPSYVMVPLTGRLAKGELSGTVTGAGCTTFAVTRR